MPNRCVAAGYSNVPARPKALVFINLLEIMIRKRKDGDFGLHLCGQNVRNGLLQTHHAFAHSILKQTISTPFHNNSKRTAFFILVA